MTTDRKQSELDRRDAPATREPRAQRVVDRAAGEWRRGRPVVLADGRGNGHVAISAEQADAERLAELAGLTAAVLEIALTARRAAALGIPAPSANVMVLTLHPGATPEIIHELADPAATACSADARPVQDRQQDWRPAGRFDNAAAAVALAKIARLLPAAVIAPVTGQPDLALWSRRQDMLFVDAGDVFRHAADAARTLRPVGEARIPLAAAPDVPARVHAFRPADGALEHLAIVIGDPAADAPMLTRVHSECFTGDLLGSLRCDCGDQLQGALAEIARAGSGILLYLAQEGRGIGLVNKLRAYQLQDMGFDTIDANEQLGFDADERVYLPAAQMLRMLGYGKVRLLTNNPEKVRALAHCGIEVTERVPHAFPSNKHNESYLRTKAQRAGHLF
ncbi:MAG: GTP cyclohydrolase II [Rhodospirillaceae bacterium]